ncbi:abortive infection system antitoxin AbiGi family protein [Spirosoma sp. RP8]|uniref:Abortive infection system antitoxin AbiGi family protein n=1 Tax=Spirosoma liriopis TaxID=2937440 RepID=A0ABT0HL49_9BACT|nr:abortive infection system antitoxin AbiGi family protein [Spirosoma liriopis]MCK8492896.1 abortive infection system antitoxin AbiGi family protein [Spirosoma liriopis]
MSILSANTLFHFTDKLQWLINILDKGFIPRCSTEFDEGNSIFGDNKHGLNVPMVCFNDIPISQLRNHIDLYGRYGIGLEKDWGIQAGVSPVFYLNKESEFVNDYLHIAGGLHNISTVLNSHAQNNQLRSVIYGLTQLQGEHSSLDLHQIDGDLFDLVIAFSALNKYYKPYKGTYRRGDKVFYDYCYYDEREWRYIPTFKNSEDQTVPEYLYEYYLMQISKRDDPGTVETLKKSLERSIKEGIPEEKIRNYSPSSMIASEEMRVKYNDALARSPRYHLVFALNRVKYIILESDTEIGLLIKALRSLQDTQPERFTDEAINLISTKIITCKQIKEDF